MVAELIGSIIAIILIVLLILIIFVFIPASIIFAFRMYQAFMLQSESIIKLAEAYTKICVKCGKSIPIDTMNCRHCNASF